MMLSLDENYRAVVGGCQHGFYPRKGRTTLTYHGTMKDGRPRYWKLDEDNDPPIHVFLDSAKQGQEFVLNVEHYTEAEEWLIYLLVRT